MKFILHKLQNHRSVSKIRDNKIEYKRRELKLYYDISAKSVEKKNKTSIYLITTFFTGIEIFNVKLFLFYFFLSIKCILKRKAV